MHRGAEVTCPQHAIRRDPTYSDSGLSSKLTRNHSFQSVTRKPELKRLRAQVPGDAGEKYPKNNPEYEVSNPSGPDSIKWG